MPASPTLGTGSRESVGLSVVIPSYNSAEWLPSTLESLVTSLKRVPSLTAEVIVVDDGSTDDTRAVLAKIGETFPFDLRVVTQPNEGRFLARWAGANAARSATMMLLDSRVLLHEDALAYWNVSDHRDAAWNANIVVDTSAPLVGLFWEAPTYVFWGAYLADRKPTVIGMDNFDRVPKGTTCFLLPTATFISACRSVWPEGDPRLTSDDTRLLRHLAAEHTILLDPGFSATYRPRTSLGKFLQHSFVRGTLFVDSYAGTSALRNAILIGLLLAPALAVVALIALAVANAWPAFAAIVLLALASLAIPALTALARHCPPRAVLAYLCLIVPFGFVFWAGLARGLVVHRRSFAKSPTKEAQAP